MFFQQIVREDLGCAAYVVGSTDAGVCAVVDPRLDEIDEILGIADSREMEIIAIVETHNHADHVAGHLEIAARTSACTYVHEAASVSYPHRPVRDGDAIEVGEVTLKVMHTPGHRPEHIALAVSDRSRSDEPWVVLTGDSLFIGDVARPDLAIDGAEGAAALYGSVFEGLMGLPDGVEVFPGHVAGSLCGRTMNLKTSSTIGYERRHNLALRSTSRSDFVRDMNQNLPERPPNMAQIVELNRATEIPSLAMPRSLSPHYVEAAGKDAVILDVRSPAEFGAGHVPGSVNVDLHASQFGTRVGFVVPADADLMLVLGGSHDLEDAVSALAVVGYNRVHGVLSGGMESWERAGLPIQTIHQISVKGLRDALEPSNGKPTEVTVLDVRERNEWVSARIPGSVHIPFHQIQARIDEVPRTSTVAIVCGSGNRSSIAASVLQACGVEGLQNVTGGMEAWEAAGYRVTALRPEA